MSNLGEIIMIKNITDEGLIANIVVIAFILMTLCFMVLCGFYADKANTEAYMKAGLFQKETPAGKIIWTKDCGN